MTQTHIVIIGAGYAGMMAALRLTKQPDAQVTLVNASPVFVERIRLHEVAAGSSKAFHALAPLLAGTGIRFVQGRVTQLDPAHKTLAIDTQAGNPMRYDKLVYALGSRVNSDSVPGVREHAYSLDPATAQRLHEALRLLPTGARVVVCGGGLTGIEGATEIAEAYPQLRVQLVTRDGFGERLSAQGQAYLRQAFARFAITVSEGVNVEAVDAGALLTTQGTIPFDLCLWAGSFVAHGLAREGGLAVNASGQIVVDDYLRSISHSDIYAAGDAAWVEGHPSPIRMGCVTAMPMGAQVAANLRVLLRGQGQQPFRFGYPGQCISLGRHDALVQLTGRDDSMREQIITGRAAAGVKEFICRFTWGTLQIERRLPGVYRYLSSAEPVVNREPSHVR
ncbi:MAG: FAD-dependent oxidoreductase [Chloroflexota bacterium]|nr:FAD-dependent oxidoreductase [Chloroflexota bacterium]